MVKVGKESKRSYQEIYEPADDENYQRAHTAMVPTEESRGSMGELLSVDFPWMESHMSISRVLVRAQHANLCACMHCGVLVLSEMDVKRHETLPSGAPCVISGCT